MYLFGDTQGPLPQQLPGPLMSNQGLIFLFRAAFSINISDFRSMKNSICFASNKFLFLSLFF